MKNQNADTEHESLQNENQANNENYWENKLLKIFNNLINDEEKLKVINYAAELLNP